MDDYGPDPALVNQAPAGLGPSGFDLGQLWQPISTAAKDDTRRLFFDDGWIFLGAWSDYFGNFHPEDRPVELYEEDEGPSHWMPLPPPPSTERI